MSLRILFINRMASLVRGGGETFDIEIARQLVSEGADVRFLSGLPVTGRALIPLKDLPVDHIRTPYFGWFPWEICRGAWRVRALDFYLFERMAVQWALAHGDAFDVVQVCELPTFVHYWKQAGAQTPVCMRVTAPDYYDPRDGLRQADAVIASGTSVERLKTGPRPDVNDIPNGVDIDRFRPGLASVRHEWGFGKEHVVVLAVARFQAVKRHDMLIDAFARARCRDPRLRLVFVGSGPLQHAIHRRCREAGCSDAVRFLGEVPYEKMPRVYASADIATVSSDYESFCFAALEGMAAGLPLVVTDTDWVPKLVGGNEGGRTVPRGDEKAFAGALFDLGQDPAKRIASGERNRRVVAEHFTWKQSAGKLAALYKRLTGHERAE
jgi:glycosyltransferase involved in cell wall biosynthesis